MVLRPFVQSKAICPYSKLEAGREAWKKRDRRHLNLRCEPLGPGTGLNRVSHAQVMKDAGGERDPASDRRQTQDA